MLQVYEICIKYLYYTYLRVINILENVNFTNYGTLCYAIY